MKQEILDLIKKVRSADQPQLHMEEDTISLLLGQEESFEGTLALSTEGAVVYGKAMSSDSRIRIANTKFGGPDPKIFYAVTSIGLDVGEEFSGEIVLVTSAGEFHIPVYLKVIRQGAGSSIGSVKNLFHFTNLAYTNYEEAYKIFCSDSFEEIFANTEGDLKNLYDCIRKSGFTMQAMEEFLIGINKKKPVILHLENESVIFPDLKDMTSGTIRIGKENWGYVDAVVSTDSDFLTLGLEKLTNADFDGKYALIPVTLHPEKMHYGKNYADIAIKNVGQTLHLSITAVRDIPLEEREDRHNQKKRRLFNLTFAKRYLEAVRTGETMESFGEASMQLIKNCSLDFMKTPDLALAYAWTCILVGDTKNASKVIFDLGRSMRRQENTMHYVTYLALKALLSGNSNEVRSAFERINLTYQRDHNNIYCLIMMLMLSRTIGRPVDDLLDEMEEQIAEGRNCTMFLAESYRHYADDPLKLKQMDHSRTKIFMYAAKKDHISPELAERIAYLSLSCKDFDVLQLRLLIFLYSMYPTKDILTAIISTLIRGNCYEKGFFTWYQKGVESDIKITGLYEAYIKTADEKMRKRFPTSVVMYFQIYNTLDYRRRAFLYVNLTRYRKSYGNIYKQYEPLISQFVTEQLLQNHMDENLARLYNAYLDPDMLTGELAKALRDMLFLRRVLVKETQVTRVLASHANVRAVQEVPVVNQEAFVHVYMNECRLLFKDADGNVWTGDDRFEIRQLLDVDKFLPAMKRFFPKDERILMYETVGPTTEYTITANDIDKFIRLSELEILEESFRDRLKGDILSFYHDNGVRGEIEESLLRINPEKLSSTGRADYVELMIERGNYAKAYELVRRFGVHRLKSRKLCILLIHLLEKEDAFYDPEILMLARTAFGMKKYNEDILRLLEHNLDDGLDLLSELKNALEAYELPSFHVKERILLRRLFIGLRDTEDLPILKAYMEEGGEEALEQLYFEIHAKEGFGEREYLSGDFVNELRRKYLDGSLDDTAGKIVLLNYYADHASRQEEEAEVIDAIVRELTGKDMKFAFFKKFSPDLQRKYFILDKTFVEYKTIPGRNVYLHYRMAKRHNSYATEKMQEIFSGVYNKEFTLFYGDALEYYFSEECGDGDERILDKHLILSDDVFLSGQKDRFSLVNDMLICDSLSDELTVREIAERYKAQEEKIDLVFTILE